MGPAEDFIQVRKELPPHAGVKWMVILEKELFKKVSSCCTLLISLCKRINSLWFVVERYNVYIVMCSKERLENKYCGFIVFTT